MSERAAELLAAVTEAEGLIRLSEELGLDRFVLAAFLAVQRGGAELRYVTPGTNLGTIARFERVRRRVLSALTDYAKLQVAGMRGGALQPERSSEICVLAMRAEYAAVRVAQAAWLAGSTCARPKSGVASRVRQRVATATEASTSTIYRAWEVVWLEFKPEPPLPAEGMADTERTAWRAWKRDRALIAKVEGNDTEIKQRIASMVKPKPPRARAGLPPMDFSRKGKREMK